MSLSDSERMESKDIAELEVRRYFDAYLQDVFPAQVKMYIDGHNTSPDAHDGVAKAFSRARWIITGAAAVAGLGAGAGLKSLLATVFAQ